MAASYRGCAGRGRAVKKRGAVLVVSAALFVAAGCGDDGVAVTEATDSPEDTATNTTTTTVVEDPSAAAEDYFRAFASSRDPEIEQMERLSEPGSRAHAYAVHQIAVVRSSAQLEDPAEITVNEDTIDLRSLDENGEPYTTTYGDFEVDPDSGKLVNFTVNGESLESRLVVGGQPASANGITVSPVSAYETITSDRLWVVVDVSNAAGQPFASAVHQADYVNRDGSQQTAAEYAGPDEIQAGATATNLMIFNSSSPGGTLFFEGYLDDFGTEVRVEVAIPAA
jgi:hypothetical protein